MQLPSRSPDLANDWPRRIRRCRNSILWIGLLGLIAAASGPSAQEESVATVDARLESYVSSGSLSGNLDAVGSDTLNNVMTLWAEGFERRHPNVRVQVEGKGSSTAPPALIQGTAQLGPMSRPMKGGERDAFEQAFNYPPTAVRVAVDAIAVFVNLDNPLDQMTVAQLDAAFSDTRSCGHLDDVTHWRDLGLEGWWGRRPISLYGRNAASGTNGFFKDRALCKGDYRRRVKEQPGSASVVHGVAEDAGGLGYSGIGYRTSGVKTLRIARDDSSPYVGTDTASVLSGDYPLSRFLLIYVNKAPGQALEPRVLEFLRFALSRDGQEAVLKGGYLPLPLTVAAEELAKLQ